MPKFRKKPVVIEAERINLFTEAEGQKTMLLGVRLLGDWYNTFRTHDGDPYITIPTSEGVMAGRHGWMLVRGVRDELYPCSPEVFAETHEEVVE